VTVTADSEVAVIGGGPAATATAVTLRKAGIDATLVAGRRRTTAYRHGEGAPPGTDRTVRQVFGTETDPFDPTAHLPTYGNRSAWGSAELLATDFMFNPFGTCWHLDRASFDDRLLDAAAAGGVRVWRDTAVVESSRRSDGWILQLDGGTSGTLRARFVCDASGRRAVVARTHGARVVRSDLLTAVVGVLRAEAGDDDDATTTVEAARDGWWYTARLPQHRRVVAFFTDPDLVELTTLRSRSDFADLVSTSTHVQAIAEEHGYAFADDPTIVPAATSQLTSTVGHGWLAVGDAAASFDPLSSQGILTALVMGRAAGTAAARACRHASHPALAEYADAYRRLVETYERDRGRYYRAEHRWAHRPFWSRRHLPQAVAAGAPPPGSSSHSIPRR
jgi:flavin-dependent dehydrogenase